MPSLRSGRLNLESLEGRDAPAFIVSWASPPAYLTVARPAQPTMLVVRAPAEGLVATTVPLNWSAPAVAGFGIPTNWVTGLSVR